MLNFSQNYLNRGFWGDEAWTSLISQLPYLQMLKTTASDFHPPGYYTIIELWYRIFPTTEVSTRIVSLIFYFLTVFMVYKLVFSITALGDLELTPEEIRKKRLWGLLAAIVVLVNPIFFTYAFEARNYTMFALAATSSVYFLLKVLVNFNKKNVLLYVIFSTLGIYTHYYMFFVLASQGLYVLIFSARGGPTFGWDRKILLKMVGAWAAVAVLYLPWIPFLAAQVSSVSESYWIGGIDKKTHFDALLRILAGEHENAFRNWLFSLSLTLIVAGLILHFRKKSFEKPYFLIWLLVVVPFVLASLPGLRLGDFQLPFRPIFFWRYLIICAVPFSVLIVYGSQRLGKSFFSFVALGLVIGLSCTIDVLTWQRFPVTFKQIYQDKIVDQIKAEDKIITVLPSFAEVMYYRNYYGLKNDIIVLPEGLVQFSGKSLLDAYVFNGVVTVENRPSTVRYFELIRDNSNNPNAKLVTSDK